MMLPRVPSRFPIVKSLGSSFPILIQGLNHGDRSVRKVTLYLEGIDESDAPLGLIRIPEIIF